MIEMVVGWSLLESVKYFPDDHTGRANRSATLAPFYRVCVIVRTSSCCMNHIYPRTNKLQSALLMCSLRRVRIFPMMFSPFHVVTSVGFWPMVSPHPHLIWVLMRSLNKNSRLLCVESITIYDCAVSCRKKGLTQYAVLHELKKCHCFHCSTLTKLVVLRESHDVRSNLVPLASIEVPYMTSKSASLERRERFMDGICAISILGVYCK